MTVVLCVISVSVCLSVCSSCGQPIINLGCSPRVLHVLMIEMYCKAERGEGGGEEEGGWEIEDGRVGG